MMSAELFGSAASEGLNAALAIELFHNFSLIHDDIMDQAPLRRGQQTIHEKHGLATAILTGDATLVLAYQYFEKYDPSIAIELMKIFNDTALGVCEGQQVDMDFESMKDIKVEMYNEMIRKKTAILLGCAMKMGAIIAKADKEKQELAYSFGINTGLAFQLQDDYLDAFASSENSGKQVGGDILANKKTFLWLRLKEKANQVDLKEIEAWEKKKEYDAALKVDFFVQKMTEYGVKEESRKLIESYTNKAFENLNSLSTDASKKQALFDLATQLLNRSF
jgi:geranylgeranyl diphosphate synthase type II